MKHSLSTKSIVALAVLSVLASTSGCKVRSKSEKDAEKEAAQEQKQAAQAVDQEHKQTVKELEAQHKLQADELARTNSARKDLNDRIAAYTALSGEYEGYYLALNNEKVQISFSLTINNLPPAIQSHRTLKEGDILAEIEALSLTATVEENWASKHATSLGTKIMSCQATAVKPDLSNGTLRVSCEANGPTPSRLYIINLDMPDGDFATVAAPDVVALRAKRVADELVQGHIKSIDAMTLKIESPYIDFNGKVLRKRAADE